MTACPAHQGPRTPSSVPTVGIAYSNCCLRPLSIHPPIPLPRRTLLHCVSVASAVLNFVPEAQHDSQLSSVLPGTQELAAEADNESGGGGVRASILNDLQTFRTLSRYLTVEHLPSTHKAPKPKNQTEQSSEQGGPCSCPVCGLLQCI